MINKKLFISFSIFIIVTVSSTISFAQSSYYGFNRDHFEKLILSKSCRGCHLYYAKLSNIDLTGADLRGAYLVGASLRKATLRNADLRGAKIGGASFNGADLTGAIWTNGKKCGDGSIGYCKMQ